jgi:glutaredoxin-dependent peroxiredoxin
MKKIIILLFVFFTICYGQENLKIRQNAPDFKLPYATKDTLDFNGIGLGAYYGKSNIILAFYPADWSGGCTKEFCNMRDNFAKLVDLNAEIYAISGDYVFSHKEWAKIQNFPFKLLSDHNHEVAKKYDSFNEKNGFNKRTIFLIDKAGKIQYIDLDYKVNDDKSFQKLKKELENLK